jgi:ABC-type nitrate/sulfonate/bicarbonate transport system ATPase subunit
MTLPVSTANRSTSAHEAAPAHMALENITFGYTATPVIKDLSWSIREGETWSVLGPSGSGKTSLLYLLAGLRNPQRGKVYFRGQPVTGPSHDVGLMLQDYGLLPWMNAERNVQLGLKIRGVPRGERHRIRAAWLERMQISEVANQYPAQMSGGQRQRVALARVLALQTEVLLLDEPLSAVDELTRERLQTTLRDIVAELGVTMIMVTHSVEEAALLTDHVLVFPEAGPLQAALTVDNPLTQPEMRKRDNPLFQQFCKQVRTELGL